MPGHTIKVSDTFWNLRGSFKIGGVLDVGTHASLVRRNNGRYVLLDACELTESMQHEASELTRGGEDLEAVLHVHPFHTVHVKKMYKRFPKAKLYGTARHLKRYPELPWEEERTEDEELHGLFAEDFDFSVPEGVDFISKNENVHFASVLVYHRASKTIHVDDTLIYLRLPPLVRAIGPKEPVAFHMTLGKALERRAGASADFRRWARDLAEGWQDAENLCAAHTATLRGTKNSGPSIHDRILTALGKAEKTLAAHEKKHG